jgi:hypothetical protein
MSTRDLQRVALALWLTNGDKDSHLPPTCLETARELMRIELSPPLADRWKPVRDQQDLRFRVVALFLFLTSDFSLSPHRECLIPSEAPNRSDLYSGMSKSRGRMNPSCSSLRSISGSNLKSLQGSRCRCFLARSIDRYHSSPAALRASPC